jgi:hypothetical protein
MPILRASRPLPVRKWASGTGFRTMNARSAHFMNLKSGDKDDQPSVYLVF